MRISVVIPTLNESYCIARTIECALKGKDVEVIVVDGGSADGTQDIAKSCGAKVLSFAPRRAGQMNAGAAAATGDALLFLHADTLLPEGYDTQVRQALSKPGVVAGAFTLKIDSPLKGLRTIERVANWRSVRLGMPYGDQGIFVRADTFRKVGGFPDMPIMEDYEFMRRLGRLGRAEIVAEPVLTSGRRWERIGVVRTTLINQAIVIGYYIGLPPEKLARMY